MDRRNFMGKVATFTIAGAAGLQLGIATGANSESGKKHNRIPMRILGKTGVEVSCLIIGGVAGMMDYPSKDFDPVELANAALDAGINYFDTASTYGAGQSEFNFGEVVATRRKEVFLSTKASSRKYDGAMKEIETSLIRLQTDHLDLWNIHGVTDAEDITLWGKPDGCLKAFYKMRDEKVIRFIGVTGHETAAAMNRAIDMYEFDTILTTYNPCPRRKPFREQVLPNALNKNMGTIAMKVMGGGGGGLVLNNKSALKIDAISGATALKYGISASPATVKKNWYWDETPHQVKASTLIRYCLGLPISCCVVGMKSLKELKLNVAAAKMTPLTKEEQIRLEQLMIGAS
jgi:aryl-alcohol dehydrogenase-like predicted oxidoreductase